MFETSGRSVELWQELFEYWKRKHVDGHPPALKDIDPIVDIPRIVANISVMDVLPDGFRYRICGSAQVLRWGQEMRGKRVGDLPSGLIPIVLPIYHEVAVTQTPKLVVARSEILGTIQYVMIAMPLVNESGKTECLLAASFYDGDFKRGTELDGMITQEALV